MSSMEEHGHGVHPREIKTVASKCGHRGIMGSSDPGENLKDTIKQGLPLVLEQR